MGHIGIITEYNPFHNGHAYQIEQLRKHFPEKKIIAVMSGNFVQRGEPAIYNKYVRCQCALFSGVDILFELPPLFATASAEHFAQAAVLALSSTGVIDTLCFGAENNNLSLFETVSSVLSEEPKDYQLLLKQLLKEGNSYPKARSLALSQYTDNADIEEFLKSPNNILGIEYIKAIKKYKLNITPFILKRQGAGYHDTTTHSFLSSATSLRQHIFNDGLTQDMATQMPSSAYNLLSNHEFANPLFPEQLYPFTQYALWEHRANYTDYLDVNEEIANRLLTIHHFPASPDNLTDELSSRNYTASRIRHALLNIVLGITKETMEEEKNRGYIRYLRLLGFQKNASSILRTMKQTSKVPIITKVASASNLLPPRDMAVFEKDLQISQLYDLIYAAQYHQQPASEYQHSVIITEEMHTI
jgi:cytidyltransferase-like protein